MNQQKAFWKRGLLHIYCGDGKGKTTAAVGLSVRAHGRGRRVVFVQFLKDGRSGEIQVLKRLEGLTVITGQTVAKFTFAMNEQERAETYALHMDYLSRAARLAHSEPIDLLVLDEVLGAIETGLLDEDTLVDFLSHRPKHLEVVLTGRIITDRLAELADYISEIRCVRHPYEQGIAAREGIEY
ncbi:MAG: cob(I)yrinic acid a,c-diamide adenosyltransferase [Eubacteriales bacterium]|nr:cob(I)yrinic acid a,c-diamide adenosyltransferase [Eubacteriales bacterium]